MQRSRRALLQRGAGGLERKGCSSGKQISYKVSVSLVLLSWGFILLLNFLVSHGNGYIDEGGEFNRHATEPDHPTMLSSIGEPVLSSSISPDHTVKSDPIPEEKVVGQSTGVDVPRNGKATSSTSKEEYISNFDSDSNPEKGTPPKSDRLSRVAPPALDEFKNRAIAAKEKRQSSQTGTVIHRLEPGGKEYNYASARKGAKVIDSNKETKGASNILDKDQDKYLRNPCSAEEKYVIIELSEETLVDTILIGNFEHYSSNFKDFEIHRSLVYPTESWVKLGNFTSQNAKHAQRFPLSEPKWARYLKLNMLSHYGSEFYCTLSLVEVYGVDAVERMLEDLISVESKHAEHKEETNGQMAQQEPTNDDVYQEHFTEISNQMPHESPKPKKEAPKSTVPDPVFDIRPPQAARMPGDTVLKILLQKVQSLDLNFSVLERYLEELNSRYSHIFQDFDEDISRKDMILEEIRSRINNLQKSKDIFAKEFEELHSWKSLVSTQLEQLAESNIMLRSEFEKVREHQYDLEKKGFAVIFLSFVFGCLAATKVFVGIVLSILRPQNSVKVSRTSSAWFFLLLSSSIIAFILVV